jgi:hypothetical protein
MIAERKVSHSALFTFLEGWHVSAVSSPLCYAVIMPSFVFLNVVASFHLHSRVFLNNDLLALVLESTVMSGLVFTRQVENL